MATKVSYNGCKFSQDNQNIPRYFHKKVLTCLSIFWVHSNMAYEKGAPMPLQVSFYFPAGLVEFTFLDADNLVIQMPQLTEAGLLYATDQFDAKVPVPFSPQLPSGRG